MQDSYNGLCPIWETQAYLTTASESNRHVYSPRAGGWYILSFWTEARINLNNDREKARFTTIILDKKKTNIEERPYIDNADIQKARNKKNLPVRERANRLLRYLSDRSEENLIGYNLHIHEKSSDAVRESDIFMERDIGEKAYNESTITYQEALAWSESTTWRELHYLIEQLAYAKLLEIVKIYGLGVTCRVTHAGYLKIEESVVHKDFSQAFVAMWFGGKNKKNMEDMDNMYNDGIKKAIENTGYKPMRIDKKDHINKIDDEIIAEIRRSHFLIADYTHGDDGARGGVYYEAGFAQGLNIPVIRSCRSDKIDNLHFDTRQYYHIEWTTPEELRKELQKRILALIGEGPEIGKAN